MEKTQTLALEHVSNLSVAESDPTPGQLIKTLIDKGQLNGDSVGVVERLVALSERMEEKAAERKFIAAFVKLQKELPKIEATKAVPNNDGTIRYHFAPYEEIMKAVKPALEANGFTVSFSMDFRDGRIVQTCTLMHVDGHSRSNQFMARIGSGPPKASEAQADGAASTYAKRFALCNALNITVETDTDGSDARKEGSPISFEQAETLRDIIKETGADEARFLKLAGAPTIDEIGSERYDLCLAALGRKRRS